MLEPSDLERAELPPITARYIEDLEVRVAELEKLLTDVKTVVRIIDQRATFDGNLQEWGALDRLRAALNKESEDDGGI